MRVVPLAVLALAGCNSLLGFELEGGGDGPFGETKTLLVTLAGQGRGTVRSMPSGINCATGGVMNCSGDFQRGGTVTLTATPAAGSLFGGWSGSGCAGTDTCAVDLDIDASVQATFDDASGGHNFAFVTKNDYPAVMFNPLSNADAICATEATAQGIPGTFRAWLSTSTVDARDRLGTARGWVRVDGRPIADTLADLTSGKLLYPVRLEADGTRAAMDGANHAVIVTGTQVNGGRAAATCTDYTMTNSQVLVGSGNGTGYLWTDWFVGNYCSQAMAIYCFGTDRTLPLTITPTQGRLAFLTTGTWTPGGGFASADAFCQTEAANAGRTGNFKALLASNAEGAASRFNANGAPWVRVDGIPLARPPLTPFTEIEAPLNQRADGTYAPSAAVATGALSPMQPSNARNCNDWTSTGGIAIVGSGEDTFGWFAEFGPATLPCNTPMLLYCFEQ